MKSAPPVDFGADCPSKICTVVRIRDRFDASIAVCVYKQQPNLKISIILLNFGYTELPDYQEKLIKMAKFAVALCILLVACSGTAYGSLLGSLQDFFGEEVSKMRAIVEGQVEQLAAYRDEFLEIRDRVIEATENTVEDVISEIQAQVDEVVSTVEESSACVSEATDFMDRASEIKDTVETCAAEPLSEVQTRYDALIDEIAAFTSVLDQVQADYEQCSSGYLIKLSCVREVATQLTGDVLIQSRTLLSELTTFGLEYLGYRQTLIACASTDGLENVQEQAAEISSGISDCLANSVDSEA